MWLVRVVSRMWVESMVWLVGVVVRRCIDFLILLIPIYTPLVYIPTPTASPYFLFSFKNATFL